MQEIWKPIKGYEGIYEISNLGRVKGLDRFVKHWKSGNTLVKSRFINKSKDKQGYIRVGLSKDSKQKLTLLHRLMAINFIPNPNRKPEVNHIDGNKLNNSIKNLEWNTRLENQRHAKSTGLNYPLTIPIKTINIKSKEVIKVYNSIKEASLDIKIGETVISKHLNGKRANCIGFKFEYMYKFKKLSELFNYVWETRDHVSEVSGIPLLPKGHIKWHWQLAHVLSRGAYPSYRLNPENIILMLPEEHENQERYQVFIDKHLELKREYYKKFYGKEFD